MYNMHLYGNQYNPQLQQQHYQHNMQEKHLQEQQRQQKQYEQYMKQQMKQQKLPRLTKLLAEQYIAHTIGVPYPSLVFARLNEEPSPQTVWKHACVQTGIMQFNLHHIQYGGTPIIFGVCDKCGKVHYYFDTQLYPTNPTQDTTYM